MYARGIPLNIDLGTLSHIATITFYSYQITNIGEIDMAIKETRQLLEKIVT